MELKELDKKAVSNLLPDRDIKAHKGDFGKILLLCGSRGYTGAAALASIEVIEEENLCEKSAHLGELFLKRMNKMKEEHKIIGDVRGKGCLLAIELVKDKATKEAYPEAGRLVYQKAFSKGLAWVPSGHILRLSPLLIMEDEMAIKGLDIIDEAIFEVERELGLA